MLKTGKVAGENIKGTCNIVIIGIPQVKQGGKLMLKAADQGNECKGIHIHGEGVTLDNTGGTVKGTSAE